MKASIRITSGDRVLILKGDCENFGLTREKDSKGGDTLGPETEFSVTLYNVTKNLTPVPEILKSKPRSK